MKMHYREFPKDLTSDDTVKVFNLFCTQIFISACFILFIEKFFKEGNIIYHTNLSVL